MRATRLVGLLLFALPRGAWAQKPVQPILGLVRQIRDRVPVPDAEVLIGNRRATTDAQGKFRIDGFAPGQYPITIRRIGYRPVRSRIAVVASEPTEAEYFMVPAPLLLPTLVVEGHRSGIYGVVGDTAFHALVGAKVEVLGNRGGQTTTDSLGQFAVPTADNGTYLVRVTYPGFTERRVLLEVEHGKGREITVRLAPGIAGTSHSDAAALFDLDRRLAFGFRQSRMTESELARYGTMSLCDVPRVLSVAGPQPDALLNGVMLLRGGQACSIRMDELSLVEFVTGGTRRGPAGPRRSAGYVIIWEKR